MREHFSVSCSYELSRWITTPPSTHAVRPTHCPRCRAPSRPAGEKLGLWGHGCRRRLLRGPLHPGGPVCDIEIQARRFLCRHCQAVILVVPGGVLPGRRYTAITIARALAVVGLGAGMPAAAREQTDQRRAPDWPSLRRWCRQARQRRLFPDLLCAPRWHRSLPRRAHEIAVQLVAHAPRWFAWHRLVEQAEVGATWMTGAPAHAYPPAPRPTNEDQDRGIARDSIATTKNVHRRPELRASAQPHHRTIALAHLARDAL